MNMLEMNPTARLMEREKALGLGLGLAINVNNTCKTIFPEATTWSNISHCHDTNEHETHENTGGWGSSIFVCARPPSTLGNIIKYPLYYLNKKEQSVSIHTYEVATRTQNRLGRVIKMMLIYRSWQVGDDVIVDGSFDFSSISAKYLADLLIRGSGVKIRPLGI